MSGLTIKRLASGYWHIRGQGPCNWAQPPAWPCDPEVLEQHFFLQAGREFRAGVAAENERLLATPDPDDDSIFDCHLCTEPFYSEDEPDQLIVNGFPGVVCPTCSRLEGD